MPDLYITLTRRAVTSALLTMLAAGGVSFAGDMSCGSLENAYGPFDYTNPAHRRDSIPIVTNAHFTPQVESLEKGQSSYIGDDIDYTLRAIPNHHRALNAMMRLEFKTGQSPPPNSRYTVDCWFDRAIRFAPNDGMVRMLYGMYLQKKGNLKEAEVNYKEAVEIMPDSAEAHYNLGLLYVETKSYDLAMAQAREAYASGYPLRGLQRKLEAAGAWRDGVASE